MAAGQPRRSLADSTEILQAAANAGNQELMMAGNAWLAVDLLEHGDRVGVDAQMEAFEAGAQRLRQPQFSWQATVWRAMIALMEGRLQDAERLAQDALSIGMRQDALTAGQYYAGQLLAIRREQLSLTELEQAARELVSRQRGPADLAARARDPAVRRRSPGGGAVGAGAVHRAGRAIADP